MDNALSFIGLMKKARALSIGVEQAVLMAELGKVKMLVLASDTAKNAVANIKDTAQEWNVPLVTSAYTKAQLGEALGQKECAAFGITDTGCAKALCEKLNLSELAQSMAEKLEREKKRIQKKTAAPAARKRRK